MNFHDPAIFLTMAVAKKPRRNNESNRRQELLRASARLFRQKGFDGTSIRDISSAAGMQSGSPFYHFKTKQDILVAVMEEGLTEGLRITSEVMALALPPEDKLVRMIRTQLATILDDAHDFVPVLHYEWRSLTPANRRRILALKDRYDALWQRLIDELQQAGHMPGDAQLMRLLILGAVNWTGAWYMPGGRLSLDDVAQGAAQLFLRNMPQ
jgi:AcrR family transcriptional regulator